jgi:hypothetical protein
MTPKRNTPSLPNLVVRFEHRDIKFLSDRTFRSLVREFTKLLRHLTVQEANDLIDSASFSPQLKQSLKDRFKNRVGQQAVYYVEDVGKGSFFLEVLLPAAGLWLLTNIILASVEKGFEESKYGAELKVGVKNFLDRIHDRLKERNNQLAKKTLQELEGKELAGRFRIVNVHARESSRRTMITMRVSTLEEPYIRIPEAPLTDKLVDSRISEARAKVEALLEEKDQNESS